MKYKENWEETKQKWEKYWKRENTGRPLMSIIAEKPEAADPVKAARMKSVDIEDKYGNPERIVERFRYFCETHDFLAESFPNLSVDFGPGSMAGYLGSENRMVPGMCGGLAGISGSHLRSGKQMVSEAPGGFPAGMRAVGRGFLCGYPGYNGKPGCPGIYAGSGKYHF